jgi:hypothetical protein
VGQLGHVLVSTKDNLIHPKIIDVLSDKKIVLIGMMK